MHPDFVNAVEMLAVPKPASLSPEQIDGARCVWCAKPPDQRLGARLSVIDGALCRWWPRACDSCTAKQAAHVHSIHIKTCARCTHQDSCPDRRALHALARTGEAVLITASRATP